VVGRAAHGGRRRTPRGHGQSRYPVPSTELNGRFGADCKPAIRRQLQSISCVSAGKAVASCACAAVFTMAMGRQSALVRHCFCMTSDVKRVRIPNSSTKSLERKTPAAKTLLPAWPEVTHWMRGRVSVLRRRHGLSRCRYEGPCGNRSLGRLRRQRRQPPQCRPRGGTSGSLGPPSKPAGSSPAGFARCRRRQCRDHPFCAGKCAIPLNVTRQTRSDGVGETTRFPGDGE
jgi:hypothetical protein